MEVDMELVETLADRAEERLIGSLQRRVRPEDVARYFIAVRAVELAHVIKQAGGNPSAHQDVVEALNSGLAEAGVCFALVPVTDRLPTAENAGS
jgi:hypothetical protein